MVERRLATLLYALWDDLTPVPSSVATTLGMPPSSHAHAARLLYVLHDDAAFPSSSHADVVRTLPLLPTDQVLAHWRRVDEALATGVRR